MGAILRNMLIAAILLLMAIFLGAGPLFLQDEPMLDVAQPPTPADVVAARTLVRDIRATAASDGEPTLSTDLAQLNSAIRLGARFIDGFRGHVGVEEQAVSGRMSVPVQWWTGPKWLNISARVPEFDEQMVLSEIRVGPTRLPPTLVQSLARHGGNLAIGNGFGDKIMAAATAMTLHDDRLVFRIALDEVGKNGVMQGAFGAMRGAEMPSADMIEMYHRQIRAAMADGRLEQTGSFLPYLRFTLETALENSTAETLPNVYTAAIFGLAKACGAGDFSFIVGRLAFDVSDWTREWDTNCDAVTFNDRIDSRRHFVTSAALQAASNSGVSVSIGEFKELYDTISGAGGFDFTDMAANLSGVALSNFMMVAPRDTWPILLDRIREENDVIVPFDGIPQIMTGPEFEALYSNIDSPRYREMIAVIERKISQCSLYQLY